jgi:OFA family oxalate/formate antiporter-like MFS transporter
MVTKKYSVLAASLVVQVCLGGLFAWSAFVNPLMEGYGFTATRTQAVFGITVAMFTVTMIAAGRLEQRFGPRPVAAVGGVLFGAGYIVAGFSGGSFFGVVLGISLLSGAGIAMGYVCPLATLIRWFPAKKGFITGVSVAGFGAGAILLSQVACALFRGGMDVLVVFRWIGGTYGIAVVAAAMFLDVPDGWDDGACDNGMELWRISKDMVFRSLLVGMFCGTFAGLIVIGNLKPIGLEAGLSVRMAELAISVFAVGNAAGRICWGWFTDKFGKWAVPASLLWLGLSVGGLFVAHGGQMHFIIAAGCVGFGFGGCFVIYVTRVASIYGSGAVGTLYPVVFLVYGFAALIGPVVAGMLYDTSKTYWGAIGLAMCVAGAGAGVTQYLAADSGRAVSDEA